MKTFTHFNKWLLAICLLLAMLVSSLSAQIIGDDEEEETVNIVKADKFLVKVNGKPVEIVIVKFQKLGMKVAETKMFLANHQGAIDLEVQTPKPGVGGTAFLKYTASSGKEVEMKIKVKFNKNLKI